MLLLIINDVYYYVDYLLLTYRSNDPYVFILKNSCFLLFYFIKAFILFEILLLLSLLLPYIDVVNLDIFYNGAILDVIDAGFTLAYYLGDAKYTLNLFSLILRYTLFNSLLVFDDFLFLILFAISLLLLIIFSSLSPSL